ncbi:hypothetical protein L1049_024398 [Liquidambar formosana]|uniref:TF-B3 domain-containing protein n=1 Tax=Liquidambar formosana TaxID=63359 RepID=A0AAP0RUT7_LIQFO
MKKTFYYTFLPSKAEEVAAAAVETTGIPHQINRVLVEIRDLHPPPPTDPNNPWHIRKMLTSSDIQTGKLLLSHNDTFDHIFRYWTLDMANYVVMGNKLPVPVWDLTDDKNPIKYCSDNIFFEKGPHESYVLGWKDLVRNRFVNSGDEIRLYWEIRSSTFQLKFLRQGL